MTDQEKRIKELEEENAKLRANILKLHDAIDSKDRLINRLQHDSWDDVTYDRDR